MDYQSNRRKHRLQMSPIEVNTIESKIHAFGEVNLSQHTVLRMAQKGVTEHEILQTLRYGILIEVHNNVPGDIRALIRLDRKKKAATCVVISLCTGEVKTAYTNDRDDNHRTLDISQYLWTPNLTQVLCVM